MGDNYISYREENGSINISEDVISGIVRAAVTEVEGVSGLSTTAGSELAEKIGLKTIPKGVTIRFEENKVVTDVIITVSYGCSVVNVAKTVQESVRNVIESVTGFNDTVVNVHVSGISFDR
ncbi:MAG: Asp23/Gls24 family envelope stress response protein [Oscillospiraceae bacterium]|nr:Asp23/Gls24 family envelope stress response protein [Oscillospiraceae bacterium]MBR0392162.1 Asp23/Gls24 family envelope stress response protein [Oscillospiraceae bacterium]